MAEGNARGPTRTGRRHELAVLTTVRVFGLMFFHTASIFSGQQLVANKMQSELTTILASLVVASEFIWIMPVLTRHSVLYTSCFSSFYWFILSSSSPSLCSCVGPRGSVWDLV